MALISPESLDRVKQAADIVEVISAHTDLRRAGARWTGLCPFHEERTPSFSVDAQEKLYHCFGCGVGGDVIKFVEEKDGLGFAEAVELLADRYGVEIEREQEDPRAEARRQQRRRLEQLLERVASYYSSYLWEAPEAGRAREYLAERGLGEEALREFGVGYAPSAWDKILVRGQRAGFSVAELHGVGLVQRGREGKEYDRFRSRIMFPIRDRRGRTLGFGGRAMRSDQGAKYVNTAETDFFHKSQLLYGVDKAKAAIAKATRAVVVEGYTDVLALHQAGVEETVAVMGTAITGEQVAALSGMVEEVVLALDADSAGQEAMLRAQRVAAGRKMRLRVAAMPAGEDPAEMMAAADGPERFRALIDAAVELNAFQVGLVLDRTDVASPAERDRALTEVAPILGAMGETASRDDLVRQVAERLDLEPAMVMGRIVAARPASGGPEQAPARTGTAPA
ncbi:MAG TPA: DNA primase, partial [Solirubrobacterales bacterium]